MKIIFMGTPEFAVPSLKILLESKHEVVAVVTGADKERGRGQKVSYTPIKEFALQNNLPVLQPEKLKDQNFIKQLKSYEPDLFVIVAFRILPKEVFTIPHEGSFNLHASILPKYRGAAPIQWALINGEEETGVTTFKLAEKVDTGSIYLQEKISIKREDNFGSLHDKMCIVGAEAVLKTVYLIEHGYKDLLRQDDNKATPAPKISKQIAQIDFGQSAENVHNLVRGLSPYPGAYFFHNNKQIKIYRSKISETEFLEAGEVKHTKKELFIGCADDALEILELQLEGKKRMGAEEFLRGFSFE
ncbi:MAG: methionyl-tRNA formyltransferase [Ignavibacteriaceae bacterium]